MQETDVRHCVPVWYQAGTCTKELFQQPAGLSLATKVCCTTRLATLAIRDLCRPATTKLRSGLNQNAMNVGLDEFYINQSNQLRCIPISVGRATHDAGVYIQARQSKLQATLNGRTGKGTRISPAEAHNQASTQTRLSANRTEENSFRTNVTALIALPPQLRPDVGDMPNLPLKSV
jgi:hypothetical protein